MKEVGQLSIIHCKIMSLVKNRHLYSPKEITEDFYIYPPLIGGNIGETILTGIDQGPNHLLC